MACVTKDKFVAQKQYLSAVHSMTCSLLWVRCLFDRFSISDFGGKWPLKSLLIILSAGAWYDCYVSVLCIQGNNIIQQYNSPWTWLMWIFISLQYVEFCARLCCVSWGALWDAIMEYWCRAARGLDISCLPKMTSLTFFPLFPSWCLKF